MIPFPNKKYRIIYADPPWKFEGNYGKVTESKLSGFGADLRYNTMSNNELFELPVSDIAEKNSAIFLWTTNKHLPVAIELIQKWKFVYRTVAFCWVKIAKSSKKPNCRMGYWTLGGIELCLLGTKGVIKPINHKIRQVHLLPREGHSKKPEKFRQEIVKLFGELPRMELFARQKTEGWDVWGDAIQ